MKTTKKKPAKKPTRRALAQQVASADLASEDVYRIYNEAKAVEDAAITHLYRFIEDNYDVYVNWLSDLHRSEHPFERRAILGFAITKWLRRRIMDIEATRKSDL